MDARIESLQDRLEQLQSRVEAAQRRSGRTGKITLVAVSKRVPASDIAEAYRCGVRHFGENRVQEFERKRPLLNLPGAVFHLVGHLQSNKARRATELFDRVDSVDSLRLARRLGDIAIGRGQKLPVLLQVHIGGEASKHGLAPESFEEVARHVVGVEGLRLEGLMVIPPFQSDPEAARPYFRQLRNLAEGLNRKNLPGVDLAVLSMGMTHDFEVAIEEGATEIRIGTALFGPREG